MNKNLVVKVKDIVSSKYGKPNKISGNTRVGKLTYIWNLKDGIELSVKREWPSTTVYLTYTYLKNYGEMIEEQKRQKKQREIKKYKSQSNAF